MEVKRRGFMAGILGAFAAAPVKVLEAAGVKESGVGSAFMGGVAPRRSMASDFGDADNWASRARLRLLAMKTLRPAWLEQRRRADAHHVGVLDIDLASFRSVSPAAKIAIQRERQYQRGMDAELQNLSIMAEEEAFGP